MNIILNPGESREEDMIRNEQRRTVLARALQRLDPTRDGLTFEPGDVEEDTVDMFLEQDEDDIMKTSASFKGASAYHPAQHSALCHHRRRHLMGDLSIHLLHRHHHHHHLSLWLKNRQRLRQRLRQRSSCDEPQGAAQADPGAVVDAAEER